MKNRVDLALSCPKLTTQELLELVIYRIQTFEDFKEVKEDTPTRVYMSDARAYAEDSLEALNKAWTNYNAIVPLHVPVSLDGRYDGPILP